MSEKDAFNAYMELSCAYFDGDVSGLPRFCSSLRRARKGITERVILNETPKFLEGRAYKIFAKTAPLYDTVENFLESLCSCFWDIHELHSARVEIKQMQQESNESLREYGLRGSMLERKIIRLYEFALEISPDQVRISRETIKTEALEYFLKGLISFPKDRIRAEEPKSLIKARDVMMRL